MPPETYELWDSAKTVSMIPWTVAAAAIIVAAALSYRRLRPRPCPHCALKQAEIVDLQEALEDARLTMLERRHAAADLRTWGTARRERTGRTWWPGDNAGRLQVHYGAAEPEPLRDPCLVEPPDDRTLQAWLDEPQGQSWPPDRVTARVEQVMALTGLEAGTVLQPTTWTVHIPQEATA